ncbi:MAG: hypothetical protein AAF682_19070 [Planctomycetota bacterium]
MRVASSPVQEPVHWRIEMDLESQALPGANLDQAGGERSVVRGGWRARLTRELGDRSFTFLMDSEASFYDWSAPAPIAGTTTDPFNDLYQTHIGAVASFAEDESIGWFTGMEIGLSGEDNADVQDAITLGAITGARCRANEDLTFSFGIAALTRLEDDPWIIPYFGFDWALTDRVRLATEGARLLLEAELSDSLDATLAAEYQLRQYRLNEDGPLGDGVFQDDQIQLTGELAWHAGENTTLTFAAGAVTWQESAFLDSDGSVLSQRETEPAAFGALTLSFRL